MSNIRYTKDHEWIRVDGNEATIGITDFAQGQLGDIVFVELPEVGRRVVGGCRAVVEARAGLDRFWSARQQSNSAI